jgi:cell division protein FtsA
MFRPSSTPILVGLEIGTAKVCAVAGEIGPAGALNIIGIGQCASKGVRKGEIVDPQQAEEDVRNAIVEAEQMADVEIRSVVLGVTGSHIRGFNNRGVHPVVAADREISPADVQEVLHNAKVVNLGTDTELLHAVRQHFRLDGQGGITNPVGMSGARLEVDMHVISGNFHRLRNAIRAVKSLQIDVEELVFNGLASSLAMLTNDQKELGALVIDLGAGTTEYTVYTKGVIRHMGVLAVGGDHLSNDIAHGLKVPLRRAEKLKLEHGSALVDPNAPGQTLTINNDLGLPLSTVNLDHLRRIMALRLEEIFEIVAQDVHRTGLMDHLGAGVLLCGGTANTPRLTELAEQVLGQPVSLARANGVSGLASSLDRPEFATGIGLVKYRSLRQKVRPERKNLLNTVRSTLGHVLTGTRMLLA